MDVNESLAKFPEQISANKQCITQKIYGIEIAPIEMMGEADLAIVMEPRKTLCELCRAMRNIMDVAKKCNRGSE